MFWHDRTIVQVSMNQVAINVKYILTHEQHLEIDSHIFMCTFESTILRYFQHIINIFKFQREKINELGTSFGVGLIRYP